MIAIMIMHKLTGKMVMLTSGVETIGSFIVDAVAAENPKEFISVNNFF
tara:strand:- start:7065 stop:7208 length:144 start_codon:yes stop_codon:yes gene_type:complete